jgi:hypothetical protein
MKPILIFGQPRSGTTWIGKLFDSHPDTLYRHEPDSVRKLEMPLFPSKEQAPRFREELEKFIASLPAMRSPEVVGKQPLFPKSYQSATGLAAYRTGVVFAKAASRAFRHFPTPFRPTAARSERARLVWKSIESQGRLGMCMEALPQARAIHLMRHPCGYVASKLRGEAGHKFESSTPSIESVWLLKRLVKTTAGKEHGFEEGDVKQLTPVEQMAWCWVLTQENILADVAGSDRVLSVRYEDVCAAPFAMTRRMFEFVGLDWLPQTERFVKASTGAASTDYYSVFKNPVASADCWRSELAPDVSECIQRILRGSRLRSVYDDQVELATSALPETAT